ncbi:LPXTG cell wall anchor domain-containing protein [Ignavigranum ruoffiae]|uniref:LPXTG cell wall anchor domain-containing protein n=1 Tax=Ignavigranum ruoffiae TaxID=89093 RepID=UPI0024AD69C4|nr:CshA/CshB family fibrillar adhesin-related protein [Ignavigranum ruoffiae]
MKFSSRNSYEQVKKFGDQQKVYALKKIGKILASVSIGSFIVMSAGSVSAEEILDIEETTQIGGEVTPGENVSLISEDQDTEELVVDEAPEISDEIIDKDGSEEVVVNQDKPMQDFDEVESSLDSESVSEEGLSATSETSNSGEVEASEEIQSVEFRRAIQSQSDTSLAEDNIELNQDFINKNVVWFDHKTAQITDRNGRQVILSPDKRLILEEGMTFIQKISDKYSVRVVIDKLRPFTATEEFKTRLDKVNAERKAQGLETFNYTDQQWGILMENSQLWNHQLATEDYNVVLRDVDSKWSNISNADVKHIQTVIGSGGEGANTGVELKVNLLDYTQGIDPIVSPIDVFAVDAEEANYSEAIIMHTDGQPWELALNAMHDLYPGLSQNDPRKGPKHDYAAVPKDSREYDVHRSVTQARDLSVLTDMWYKEIGKAQGITYQQAKEIRRVFQTGGTYNGYSAAQLERMMRNDLAPVYQRIRSEVLAGTNPDYLIDEGGNLRAVHFDTLYTRFEEESVRDNRQAAVRTPAEAWIATQKDGGLGTQWFGPVLTAQDFRSVPLLLTRNAEKIDIYVASTGAQQAAIGFYVGGRFQDHHRYYTVNKDFDGNILEDTRQENKDLSYSGPLQFGKVTEQYQTQKDSNTEPAKHGYVLEENGVTNPIEDPTYSENGDLVTGYFKHDKTQEITYNYVKYRQPGRFQDSHKYYIDYVDETGAVIRTEEVTDLNHTNEVQEGYADEQFEANLEEQEAFKFEKTDQASLSDDTYYDSDSHITQGNFEAGKLQAITYIYRKQVNEVTEGQFQDQHNYIDVEKDFEGNEISRTKNEELSHATDPQHGKEDATYTTQQVPKEGYDLTKVEATQGDPQFSEDGTLTEGNFKKGQSEEVTYTYEKVRQPGRFQDSHKYYIDYVDETGAVIRTEEVTDLNHTNEVQEGYADEQFEANLEEQEAFKFEKTDQASLSDDTYYDSDSHITQGNFEAGKLQAITYIYRKQVMVKPEEPDNPSVPEDPEIPEKPEKPDEPEKPEVPEYPEKPGQPEIPDLPQTPDYPKDPSESDKPGHPQDSDNIELDLNFDKALDTSKVEISQANVLPETGEVNQISIFTGAALSILSGLGLIVRNKKEEL